MRRALRVLACALLGHIVFETTEQRTGKSGYTVTVTMETCRRCDLQVVRNVVRRPRVLET